MTLTIADVAAIVLAILLLSLIDKMCGWALYRITGKCWLCRKHRVQEDFEREFGGDDDEDDDDLEPNPA